MPPLAALLPGAAAAAGTGAAAAGTATAATGAATTLGVLKTASTVASLAGTAASTYGAYQGAKQEEAMNAYNAQLAEANAKRISVESSEKQTRMRRQHRAFLDKQRGAFAKAGLSMSGTSLEVMGQSAADLELSILDQAYASDTQRLSLLADKKISNIKARSAGRSALPAAGSQLIGGVNQLARMRL